MKSNISRMYGSLPKDINVIIHILTNNVFPRNFVSEALTMQSPPVIKTGFNTQRVEKALFLALGLRGRGTSSGNFYCGLFLCVA